MFAGFPMPLALSASPSGLAVFEAGAVRVADTNLALIRVAAADGSRGDDVETSGFAKKQGECLRTRSPSAKSPFPHLLSPRTCTCAVIAFSFSASGRQTPYPRGILPSHRIYVLFDHLPPIQLSAVQGCWGWTLCVPRAAAKGQAHTRENPRSRARHPSASWSKAGQGEDG